MLNVAISVAVKVEGTALAAGVVEISVHFFFWREFTSWTPFLLYVYLGPLTCKPRLG